MLHEKKPSIPTNHILHPENVYAIPHYQAMDAILMSNFCS
jgi:hypothetical protein